MAQSHAALNRLAKWRTVFAGWQLGTRPKGDPESDAVRDHREATMMLRVEVTALTSLLLDRKFFTHADYEAALVTAARALDADYERRFPGFRATDDGMEIDVQMAHETTKGWRP